MNQPEDEYLYRGTFVHMREMRGDDSETIVRWRTTPQAKRWLGGAETLTVENQVAWFDRCKSQGDVLLMYDSPDGRPILSMSIYDFTDDGKSAEQGRAVRGESGGGWQALTEAIYLQQRLAFELLSMKRVFGAAATDNEAVGMSLHAMLRCGNIVEGIRRQHLRKHGNAHDVIEFGVLAEDFARAKSGFESDFYDQASVPVATPLALEVATRIAAIVSPMTEPLSNTR